MFPRNVLRFVRLQGTRVSQSTQRHGRRFLSRTAIGLTTVTAVSMMVAAPIKPADPASSNSSPASSYPLGITASRMEVDPTKPPKGWHSEDSFFVLEDSLGIAVGVADGVGGWREDNIDPSLFSNELMAKVKEVASLHPELRRDLRQLLYRAHKAMNPETQGSTTVTLLSVLPDAKTGELIARFTSLGDSAVLGYRPSNSSSDPIILRTPEQQKCFDFPMQLGSPSCKCSGCARHGFTGHGDPVYSSQFGSIVAQPNDLFLLGTDGLFDNLFNEQITAVIREFLQNKQQNLRLSREELQQLTENLVQSAIKVSLDPTAHNPYNANASVAYPPHQITGGKTDDITLVVVQVQGNQK